MEHTKEPWAVFRATYQGTQSVTAIAESNRKNKDPSKGICILFPGKEEDARRIVACVNACAGIKTEALENRAHPIKDDLDYLARKSEEYMKDAHDQYGFLAKITRVEEALESSGITADKCGRDMSEGVRILTAQRDELLAALTHAATDYIDQNGSVPSWWTDKIRQMVKETTHA